MTRRPVRRFVDGLLQGQRAARARPDNIEANEMKTAIELRAARTGSDSPREEFITDLHRRLSEQMGDAPASQRGSSWGPSGTRRQVVIGTGLAAASAAAGIVVGRNLLAPSTGPAKEAAPAQGVLEPNAGTWHAVGASADLPKGGALAFDLGSVTDSCTAATRYSRPSRASAPIRAASCGLTLRMRGCAARATRRRSRWKVRH